MCNKDGKFLVYQQAKVFIVNPDTWTAGPTTAAAIGSTDPQLPFRNIRPGTTSIWLSSPEYDTADGSLIRSVDLTDWTASVSGARLYDPIQHAIITGTAGGTAWLYLDRIDSPGVTLMDKLEDISEWLACSLIVPPALPAANDQAADAA
jgi:hypothetical protein